MSIGEQFSGLDMAQLIGGPLSAASDASINLANSTADFINKVGFDQDGRIRTAAFKYERKSANDNGTINLDEMKVDVPMLAIVPIPNLQVDEVNILFDMEVKQSEKSESATDLSATVTGSLNLGIIKVSVTGSVSSHSSNTRSSDNSAKYHVDVRATNHGTPEGLLKVLDMMAACISPTLVGSTPKDANGQNLTGDAKAKTERIKALRQELSIMDNRLIAAKSTLDSSLIQLKKVGTTQQNAYQAKITQALSALEENDPLYEEISKVSGEVVQTWADFQIQAPETIKMITASGEAEKGEELSKLFVLKAVKDNQANAYEKGESHYSALAAAQNNAISAQREMEALEKQILDKKAEYSNAIAGIKPTAVDPNPSKG